MVFERIALPGQPGRAIGELRAAMGKRELRKKVNTLEQRIREHGTKILIERARAQPDEGRIRHLETEIRAFRDGIKRALKRLGDRK